MLMKKFVFLLHPIFAIFCRKPIVALKIDLGELE